MTRSRVRPIIEFSDRNARGYEQKISLFSIKTEFSRLLHNIYTLCKQISFARKSSKPIFSFFLGKILSKRQLKIRIFHQNRGKKAKKNPSKPQFEPPSHTVFLDNRDPIQHPDNHKTQNERGNAAKRNGEKRIKTRRRPPDLRKQDIEQIVNQIHSERIPRQGPNPKFSPLRKLDF